MHRALLQRKVERDLLVRGRIHAIVGVRGKADGRILDPVFPGRHMVDKEWPWLPDNTLTVIWLGFEPPAKAPEGASPTPFRFLMLAPLETGPSKTIALGNAMARDLWKLSPV